MGHRGSSKRQIVMSPTTDELDNSIPALPRPPSSGPSLSVIASAAQLSDFDGRRRHTPLGSLFPLHPRHRPSSALASENPQFPLMAAADDDRAGGRALLNEFLTFLDLKGANCARVIALFMCSVATVIFEMKLTISLPIPLRLYTLPCWSRSVWR